MATEKLYKRVSFSHIMPRKKSDKPEEESKSKKPKKATEKSHKEIAETGSITESIATNNISTEREAPAEKPAKPKKSEKIKPEEVASKTSENTLIPLNDYIRAGAYIGTKVIPPHMRPFIYRRRNDGIAIINTNFIDEKLKEAARFLGDYNPDNVIVVSKRESGWRAVKLFSELTGIRCFTK